MPAKLRISGGRKLHSPQGIGTRPTTGIVREAVMNMLSGTLKDSNWLDLCSGSGSMGCEALQKGAKSVIAIEKNKKVADICRLNLELIRLHSSQEIHTMVICDEVIRFLRKGFKRFSKISQIKSRFDLIYLDPPYDSSLCQGILNELLNGIWIKGESIVICEYSSKMRIKVDEPWVEINRRNYGKSELLFLNPPISYCVDIDSKQQRTSPGG